MNEQEFFEKVKETAEEDIKGHLDVLKRYASQCTSVTEFGFRHGTSFAALIAGRPMTAITYDLHFRDEDIKKFKDLETDIKMDFRKENTIHADIEHTELLFIDSLHTYAQLKEELKRNAHKVAGFLIFHDIETYGARGEDGTEPGLMRAILELMAAGGWAVDYYTPICNGLIVLARI